MFRERHPAGTALSEKHAVPGQTGRPRAARSLLYKAETRAGVLGTFETCQFEVK